MSRQERTSEEIVRDRLDIPPVIDLFNQVTDDLLIRFDGHGLPPPRYANDVASSSIHDWLPAISDQQKI
jgi:hypothetical protein